MLKICRLHRPQILRKVSILNWYNWQIFNDSHCIYHIHRAMTLSYQVILFQKHMALSHGGTTYPCSECDYVAYIPATLKQHEAVHKEIGEFYCETCDQHFKVKYTYKQHMMKHEGNLPFRYLARWSFSSIFSIMLNWLYFVSKVKIFFWYDTEHRSQDLFYVIRLTLYYRCDKCPKAYSSNNALQYHLQSHSETPPCWQCVRCGKGYITKSGLDNHMKSHDNLKQWKCSVCNKGFNSKQVGLWVAFSVGWWMAGQGGCSRICGLVKTHITIFWHEMAFKMPEWYMSLCQIVGVIMVIPYLYVQ